MHNLTCQKQGKIKLLSTLGIDPLSKKLASLTILKFCMQAYNLNVYYVYYYFITYYYLAPL